jgi:hypothetical protein
MGRTSKMRNIQKVGQLNGGSERFSKKIIPNNRKVLAHLDASKRLLKYCELVTLEKFRQHIDDLEARHIEGYQEGASQFPKDMSDILRD